MAKKLFVGGLAWATTDDGLRQAFDRFGEVSEAKVIMDRETGRSRGFGFVSFANDDHCQAAMREMDGAQLDGREQRLRPRWLEVCGLNDCHRKEATPGSPQCHFGAASIASMLKAR